MGVFSYVKRKFGELGGYEYTKQQIEDAARFGVITKALLPDLSIQDAQKIPTILLAAAKFVGQHGRPNLVNVAAALEEEGIDVPGFVPDPPPPLSPD